MADQLLSYIALAAPATRRPARGDEPFLRPEFGFTPNWFRQSVGVDFGERWHTDPGYRRDTLIAMGREVRRRFRSLPIGYPLDLQEPEDLLTGTFGTCVVASIYGVPSLFSSNNWPVSEHQYLSPDEVDRLEPPQLEYNAFFQGILEQVEWIAREQGRVEGYLNWQGVLNNAYRLRGPDLFVDMALEPARATHLFECIRTTMAEGARQLYAVQRKSGVEVRHFTMSNCLVNMVSPKQYRDLLLPHDRWLADQFGLVGIHNCAWCADGYMEDYATVPGVSYIDMGMDSDLSRAKELFPRARRAIMYTPMDLAEKPQERLRADLETIAHRYGPCDIVFADIEAGVPDERVLAAAEICESLSVHHHNN